MMMQIADTIHKRMGWCPLTGTFQTALTDPALSHPPEGSNEPDGGGDGGRNRIGLGTQFAVDSVKFLVKNKSLLWFSFLTGLVTAFVFIVQYLWHVLARYPFNLISYPGFIHPRFLFYNPGAIIFTAVTFFIVIFSLAILFAGLTACVSNGQTGGKNSIREGLSKTRDHIRPLAGWSAFIALIGTALYTILQYIGYLPHAIERILNQFPFYFILIPEVYGKGPIAGGFHTLSALSSTLIIMAISILLLALTIYLIPAVVLENRSLSAAVRETAPLLKKTWSEIITCFFTIGLVIAGAALLSLLFHVVYGIVAPGQSLVWQPGDAWMAAAILFMAAFIALIFIGTTVAGIAGMKIYTYGKTGHLPITDETRKYCTEVA